MDNRLRFLYCCMSELWGTQRESTGAEWKAARKRGGTSLAGKAARQWEGRDADRNLVGKCVSQLSRKAAIVHTAPVP